MSERPTNPSPDRRQADHTQAERTEAAPPRRFYYGWVIVSVFFMVEFVTYSTTGSIITLFFPSMMEEMGWTLTQLTGAVTTAGIAGMFAAPIVGPLLDRYGGRPVLAIGALVAGGALLLMARVQEVWQYWLLFGAVGALGMGELGRLSTPVVIAKWFVRMRGRALAIATSGNMVGGMIMAPVMGSVIAWVGWRDTWALLAGAILLLNLPLVVIFMRRVPEDMGLRPDGDPPLEEIPGTPVAGRRSYATEQSWTLKTASRTRSLWLMVVASNFVGFATAAVSYHQIIFFVNEGMSIQSASYVLSASLLFSALARFLWGFLVERFSVRACLSTMAGFRALGTLSLVVVPYPFNIGTFVIGWGLLGGAFGLLQPIAWSDYYGRGFQGSIQGTLRPLLTASRLIAPISMAVLFDITGSYDVAFGLAFVVAAASIGLFWLAKPPTLPEPEGTGASGAGGRDSDMVEPSS
jgi:MFS family permease